MQNRKVAIIVGVGIGLLIVAAVAVVFLGRSGSKVSPLESADSGSGFVTGTVPQRGDAPFGEDAGGSSAEGENQDLGGLSEEGIAVDSEEEGMLSEMSAADDVPSFEDESEATPE